MRRSPAASASSATCCISSATVCMSCSRQAACAARYRRRRVGSSSTARRSSERAVWNASRFSARLPAPSSAVAARSRSSSGAVPSSSSRRQDRAVEMVARGSPSARRRCGRAASARTTRGARARVALLTPSYATSAMRMCLKRNARSPAIVERSSARTSSRVDQRVDHRGRVELWSELFQRSVPEDAADHGRALEQLLLVRRQCVDPRGDQRVDRVGDDVASPPLSASIRSVSSRKSGLPSAFSRTSARCSGARAPSRPSASCLAQQYEQLNQ